MGKPHGKEPDSSLVARVCQGEADALRDIYMVYAAPLTGYIYSIVRDTAASEDLTHDIFIRIWERRSEWRPANGIASYLYKAARNRAFDYQDRMRVRSRAEAVNENETVANVSSAQSSEDLEARIRQVIDLLPERRRVALTLRAMHDMSYSDIAATLEITETAARILVTRAREELRARLGEDIEV